MSQPVPRSYLNSRRVRPVMTRRNTSLPPTRGMIDAINLSGTQGRVHYTFLSARTNRITDRIPADSLRFKSFKVVYIQNFGDNQKTRRTASPHHVPINIHPFLRYTPPGQFQRSIGNAPPVFPELLGNVSYHYFNPRNSLQIFSKNQFYQFATLTSFNKDPLSQITWNTLASSPFVPESDFRFFTFRPGQNAVNNSDSNYTFSVFKVNKEAINTTLLNPPTNVNTANVALNFFGYFLSQKKNSSQLLRTDTNGLYIYSHLKNPVVFLAAGSASPTPLPLTLINNAPSTSQIGIKKFAIEFLAAAKPVEVYYSIPLTKTEEMQVRLWIDRESRPFRVDSKISPNVFPRALL